MEEQINIAEQFPQPAGQNPVVEPTEVKTKPKTKYWVALVFFIIVILVVGGVFFTMNQRNNNNNENNKKEVPINQPIVNPNTGDLYQDIKIRMKELLP